MSNCNHGNSDGSKENPFIFELQSLRDENKRLREALESISKNSCCETCQQAKLVALEALRGSGEK